MVEERLLLKREVEISVGTVTLKGEIIMPVGAKGIVIFSHGSGSSKFSPRNRFVSDKIQKEGIATFMFDLLTEEEDLDYQKRFDIDLLTERLILVTGWLKEQNEAKDLLLGYFGASTGAASALRAAALIGDNIKAVVSRGGRPDLAAELLPIVKSPTLLIVGSMDFPVVQLNAKAFSLLSSPKKMIEIEGATHLFEEIGKLEEVSYYASVWFRKYLNGEDQILI